MRTRTSMGIGLAGGVLLGAAAIGGAWWAGSGATQAGCGSTGSRLTVVGTGSASGTPNRVTLTVDVSVIGSSARSALSQDNTAAAAVIAAVTKSGVPSRDVQTTNLSVQPDYTPSHGTTVLSGYSVDNSVVATIDHISDAGPVVDAVTATAGNAVRIGSLAFSIADPRRLEDLARQNAVHQAASHAASMAAAAGQRLGTICSVSDQSSSVAPPYNTYAFGSSQPASAAAPGVPLQAGTQRASAQVSVVYSLRPSGGG